MCSLTISYKEDCICFEIRTSKPQSGFYNQISSYRDLMESNMEPFWIISKYSLHYKHPTLHHNSCWTCIKQDWCFVQLRLTLQLTIAGLHVALIEFRHIHLIFRHPLWKILQYSSIEEVQNSNRFTSNRKHFVYSVICYSQW